MSAINYGVLSDSEKLDLLRLLYTDIKTKEKKGLCLARDLEQKELIIAETQVVYDRIKKRRH